MTNKTKTKTKEQQTEKTNDKDKDQYKTRPSALGKSDPFCGPSNPRYLFTEDYAIFFY